MDIHLNLKLKWKWKSNLNLFGLYGSGVGAGLHKKIGGGLEKCKRNLATSRHLRMESNIMRKKRKKHPFDKNRRLRDVYKQQQEQEQALSITNHYHSQDQDIHND